MIILDPNDYGAASNSRDRQLEWYIWTEMDAFEHTPKSRMGRARSGTGYNQKTRVRGGK